MTSSDDLQLPRDPGPVPAPLRDAFAWARDAERTSSPAAPLDDAALDALAASEGDDEARFAMIEQLLGSPDGARTLAHIVAARTSTAGTEEFFDAAEDVAPSTPRGFVDGSLDARRRNAIAGLKPMLLAASLMLVAGTSWYVFTLPRRGDEVRSAGSAVELLAVPTGAARSPIPLRWTGTRTDERYSIEVLDANDVPVFASDTNATQVMIPGALLKPGTYRWYVRARGSDRTEVQSTVATFTVE
jgi:hypothetical protein